MTILVTGGSGFIGSHVVDKLRERNITVRIFDMVYPTHRSDVEFYHGSLLDFEAVRMAGNVDYIIHFGAVANVNDVVAEPLRSENINVRGTINVLETARRSDMVKRVIYVSTIWVYGETDGVLLDEDTPLARPSHLYTATKLIGEYYCHCYNTHYELPYTILRYGIPYGPRARAATVVSLFVDKALNGEPLTVAGDGTQYRKFVYVEDLAEGTVLGLKKVAENRTYNLEGDEIVTINRLAELVKEYVNPEVEITHIPARGADFSGKEISNERAKKELGWSPKTPFEEGLKKYISWYKEEVARLKEEEAKILL